MSHAAFDMGCSLPVIFPDARCEAYLALRHDTSSRSCPPSFLPTSRPILSCPSDWCHPVLDVLRPPATIVTLMPYRPTMKRHPFHAHGTPVQALMSHASFRRITENIELQRHFSRAKIE